MAVSTIVHFLEDSQTCLKAIKDKQRISLDQLPFENIPGNRIAIVK